MSPFCWEKTEQSDSLISVTSFCKERNEITGSKRKEVGSELDFLRHISLLLQLNRLWTSLKEKCAGNICRTGSILKSHQSQMCSA